MSKFLKVFIMEDIYLCFKDQNGLNNFAKSNLIGLLS